MKKTEVTLLYSATTIAALDTESERNFSHMVRHVKNVQLALDEDLGLSTC
jgi:hypothetical protein